MINLKDIEEIPADEELSVMFKGCIMEQNKKVQAIRKHCSQIMEKWPPEGLLKQVIIASDEEFDLLVNHFKCVFENKSENSLNISSNAYNWMWPSNNTVYSVILLRDKAMVSITMDEPEDAVYIIGA